jgi:hypothetical protein
MRGLFKAACDQLALICTMPQNPVTLVAKLDQMQEGALRDCLDLINEDTGGNDVLPFDDFREVLHFARLFVLEGVDHPKTYGSSLVFMANVDISDTQFLTELIDKAASGVDELFSRCEQYPPVAERTASSRLSFLQERLVPAQAYYVNTIGRTVKQILEEDALRQAIQDFLQTLDLNHFESARELRQKVVDFVMAQSQLAWARTPLKPLPLWWRIKEKIRFGLLLFLGIVLVLWLWPVLLGAFIALQIKERKDIPDSHRPLLSRLHQLRAREDFAAHNQFTATGFLKSGLLRRVTVRTVLGIAHITLRHVFNHGDLAGVPLLGLDGVDTIHFARWVMIDDDRRLLFSSNYDGSLESYMVDFVDKVAWGLNLVFSNGLGYPKTNLLVLEGARDEERFKDFIGNHQFETQVWHTPYPHLTAVNISNNALIRAGLYGEMTEPQAQAWLTLL